jgi:hypothetical protein
MSWPIELLACDVSWCRPAVDNAAMGLAPRKKQIVRFLGKRMVRPVAG